MCETRASLDAASAQASARATVAGRAPRSRTGDFSDGGTFISARTVRMAVTKRITQSISARA
jgi:hypothetical protein